MREQVLSELKKILEKIGVEDEIAPEASLMDDLGLESLQIYEMLSDLETFTASEENTYCYYANSKEADEAHERGLSCGKYRAYLKLRDVNPEITVDQVRNMTMREIWDLIGNESDSPDSHHPHAGSGNENGHGGHGAGVRGGHGWRNRYGAEGD